MLTRRVPEKSVQLHVTALLRSCGAAVYVLGTRRRRGDYQGTMQTPGIPDLYAFLPAPPLGQTSRGTTLWFECKAEGGRLSPAQEEFQAACVRAGHHYACGGVDAAIAFLVQGGWLKSSSVAHYRQPAPAPLSSEA